MAKAKTENINDKYAKTFLNEIPKHAHKALEHIDRARAEVMEVGKISITAGREYNGGAKATTGKGKGKGKSNGGGKPKAAKTDKAEQDSALAEMQAAQTGGGGGKGKGKGKAKSKSRPSSEDDFASFFGAGKGKGKGGTKVKGVRIDAAEATVTVH